MSKTYTFKHEIGKEVWTIKDNCVKRVKIYRHKVDTTFDTTNNGVYMITNLDDDIERMAHESELFETKKELLDSL